MSGRMGDPAWLRDPVSVAGRENLRAAVKALVDPLRKALIRAIPLRDRARSVGKMGLWKEPTSYRPWHTEHAACGWHVRWQTHERAALALRQHAGHWCRLKHGLAER